jgi:hypothetical protein
MWWGLGEVEHSEAVLGAVNDLVRRPQDFLQVY